MGVRIKATIRDIKGKKVKRLRRQGIIPGAVSRYKAETLLIQLDRAEAQKLVNIEATSIVELAVDGMEKPIKALVTEVLKDPITEELLSVTLTEITPHSELRVEVPIKLVGESPILKKNLGVLVISKPFVKLVVNSENILDEIEIDLSKLENVGDSISVREILSKLPEGVKLASYKEIDDAIVTVVPLQKTLAEEAEGGTVEAVEAPEEEIGGTAEE